MTASGTRFASNEGYRESISMNIADVARNLEELHQWTGHPFLEVIAGKCAVIAGSSNAWAMSVSNRCLTYTAMTKDMLDNLLYRRAGIKRTFRPGSSLGSLHGGIRTNSQIASSLDSILNAYMERERQFDVPMLNARMHACRL